MSHWLRRASDPGPRSRPAALGGRCGKARVLLTGIGLWTCLASPAAASSQTVAVSLDASAVAGPVPLIQRVGTWPFTPAPPAYVQDRFFADFQAGTLQIDLGRDVFAPARDVGDVMGRLAVLDPFLLRARAANFEVVVAFSRMPPFLSSAKGSMDRAMAGDATSVEVASPPEDLEAWGGLVKQVVSHIRDLGIHAAYNVGWEPDTPIWQGTADQFNALYKASASAVKRADPQARVGGPAVSDFGPQWRDAAGAPSMIDGFLAFAGRTGLPELGLDRLPVDFVSYHLFGASIATSYATRARWIAAALARNGYDPKTPTFVGEWSDSPEPASARRDDPFMASYVVANVAAMSEAGVGSASFTSLTEQRVAPDTEFNGGFGLFTKDFIERCSYRAFQALGELSGDTVPARSSSPNIVALASRSEDRVAVVAANVVPFGAMYEHEFVDRLIDRGFPLPAVAAALGSAERMRAVLRSEVPIDALSAPGPLRAAISEEAVRVRSRAAAAIEGAKSPTSVRFDLSGLGWLGAGELSVLRIDADHANPALLRRDIDARMSRVARRSADRVKADYREILGAARFSKAQIAELAPLGAGGDATAYLASLDTPDRLDVIRMIRTLQADQDAEVASAADVFNRDPRLAFAPSERRPLEAADRFEAVFQLDPGAVIVLVFKRK